MLNHVAVEVVAENGRQYSCILQGSRDIRATAGFDRSGDALQHETDRMIDFEKPGQTVQALLNIDGTMVPLEATAANLAGIWAAGEFVQHDIDTAHGRSYFATLQQRQASVGLAEAIWGGQYR